MSQDRFVGIQWRFVFTFLGITLLVALATGVGFMAARHFGMEPEGALGAGLILGVAAGLVGSVVGLVFARSMKVRLWEAGDMAGRIARGDFGVRLPVGMHDEIGWLEEQLNRMASHLEVAVNELRELAEQNRRLAEEAGRGAAVEERARLSRDLHDTVNQQLFSLAMGMAAVRRRVEQGKADQIVDELSHLEQLARETHAQTRRLILQLRPTTLERHGLGAALREYAGTVAGREGWQLTTTIDTDVQLPLATGEALFRIAQEALHNAAKHAAATSITLRLGRVGGEVHLEVIDDGRGFDLRAAVRPTAVGLAGMRERAAAFQGEVQVTSRPGAGTAVRVRLPVPEEGGNRIDSGVTGR